MITESLETEQAREEHDTVFLVIRKFTFEEEDMIEAAFHTLEDAREYGEEEFPGTEHCLIREQVVE